MARKSQSSSKPKKRYNLTNVDFSYNERKEINEWLHVTPAVFEDLVLDMADSDIKLSFSRDSWNDCYCASLTPKGLPDDVTDVPVYVLRHNDITKLLGLVFYFYVVRLDRGDNLVSSETSNFDW